MTRVLLLVTALAACAEPPAPTPTQETRGELGPLDALARRFGRVRRRMQARGYGTAVMLDRTMVLEQRGHAFRLDLPVGLCTTVVALGGGTMRELMMKLYDNHGALVAVDSQPSEAGLVHFCPEAGVGSTFAHLTLQAETGLGAVVMAAFESERGEGEGFENLFDNVVAPQAPLGPAEESLDLARRALEERGLTLSQGPELVRLGEGQATRAMVTLRRDECLVLVGRSDQGIRDLDLYLYGPDGTEVARDLGVETEPQLEYCAEVDGEGTLELRAFEGSGAAGWSAWRSPREEAQDEPPEALAPPERDPLSQVISEATRLADRGFGEPIVAREDGMVSPGETVAIEIPLGPGCAWVLAAAGPGDLDLDLYLQDLDGQNVDRDVRVRPTARVGACPSQRTMHRLLVKGYGAGHFSVATITAPDSLRSLAELRADGAESALVARGFTRLRRESQDTATGTRELTVAAGRCVALVVAGGTGLSDVDLVVRDQADNRLASDTGPAPWASVSACAEAEPQRVVFDVIPYRGDGPIAMTWMQR